MPDLQPQQDVVIDSPPFKKVVMLQHISDVGGAVPERLPVQIYLSVLRGDEAADNGQQGRFADGAAAATFM